ncbi:MAG: hypothetical protein ACRDGE_00580 [Candidatus Limnocylindria bacterium]
MSDERWLEDRMRMEATAIPLPRRERWAPAPRRPVRPLAAAIAIPLVIGIALVLGPSLRELRLTPAPVATDPGGTVQLERPPVPDNWELHVGQRVIVAVPREFGGPEPDLILDDPIVGYLLFPAGQVSVIVWEGEAERIVEERFIQGNLQPVSRRDVTSPRRAIELTVSGIRWSDPSSGTAGTYEARSLFFQLTPTLMAQVSMAADHVADQASRLSAEQMRLQDQIALYVEPALDTERSYSHEEVEAALSSVVTLDPRSIGAGGDVTSGDERLYGLSGSSSFLYVSVYPDRSARVADDPNEGGGVGSMISWRARVTYRGVGNVLIIVGSDDPDLRYRVATALNELASQ